MSFSLTVPQMRARTKTVTRRFSWFGLKVGTVLQAIEKGQGLKKGERVVPIGRIRIVAVRVEPVRDLLVEPYGTEEATKEGFPGLSGKEFAERFCELAACTLDTDVRRIEFAHVEAADG